MKTPILKPLQSFHRTGLARAAAALLAASALATAPHANAAAFISVNIAPPPLPVYEQPYMPGPGYLWSPGYWAWDADINDYFWVPGTWVRAPYVGALWTPGYWGWGGSAYIFHPGYWGPHIGYYGGINYGYGYFGLGYAGGYWRNGGFWYNSAYNRYGSGIHISFYNRPFAGVISTDHFSFNGPNGVVRAEVDEERVADRDHHIGPDAEQLRHVEAASHDETLRSKNNHGTPALAATSHAGAFEHGHEVASHETMSASHTSTSHESHGSSSHESHESHDASSHGAPASTQSPEHHHEHSTAGAQPMVQAPHTTSPNPGQPAHAPPSHESHPSNDSKSHKDDHHH